MLTPATGGLSLVSDQLASPADFILHKYIHTQIKNTDAVTLVLSVSQDIGRWNAVAAKSNINLTSAVTSGSLTFVNVLSQVSPTKTLRPIYDIVSKAVTSSHNVLVVLDDISSLEWIGFSPIDLQRFVRALYALCGKTSAALVIRHHLLSPTPDELFRLLLQLCSYHIEVRPLASGKSGAVSGEIAIHAGPSTRFNADIQTVSRSKAVQYRLTDTGAVFFEKGIGAGLL